MIVKKVLLVVRIGLHRFVVLQALEYDLAEAVVVGHIRHLSVEELGHEGPGLEGVVDDGPSPHAVFHHQVFGQRSRDFVHVAPVCFFAHACFAVAEDGEAEVSARGQAWVLVIRRQGVLLCGEGHCLCRHGGKGRCQILSTCIDRVLKRS